MNRISKEIGIFLSTLLICFIAHKLDCYNIMTIYLLVRIWFTELEKGSEE